MAKNVRYYEFSIYIITMVPFYFSALEESSTEVKHQSSEQLQRMQRVIDAWQSQVC